jgi:hypothetical protein
MSGQNISGTPLQVDLKYVRVGASPPPEDHFLAGPSFGFFRSLLEDRLSPAAKSTLEDLLSVPLDQRFDDMWAQQLPVARGLMIKTIQDADGNAYDIQCSLPLKGTLEAEVGGVASGLLAMLPPATPASQLTLRYLLPGVRVTFSERTKGFFGFLGSWFDPVMRVTFDASFNVYLAVPNDPRVPFSLKSDFETANTKFSGNGIEGDILLGLKRLWGRMIETPFNDPEDQTFTPVTVAALSRIFDSASVALSQVADAGFTQLGVGIDTNPPAGAVPGNTVTFYLTHAFDPGPLVIDPQRAQGADVFISQARLTTSVTQLHAGDDLGVVGTSFPPARARMLAITWADTTSGFVTQSEVQWGPELVGLGGRETPPVLPASTAIERHGQYDSANRFVAKGLIPDTDYAFRVRDYDAGNLVATDWSDWTVLRTGSSDQVDLVLDDGNGTVVGSASVQLDGTFSATAHVPAGETPGTYALNAVMSGQQLADTTITVIAAGEQLQPEVRAMRNDGTPFASADFVVTNRPLHLTGVNFAPGAVDLFIDSVAGTKLGSAQADASGVFDASPVWPYGVTGHHAVIAREGALQATAVLEAEDPPK